MPSPPPWLVATPVAHRGLHDAAAGVVENTLPAAQAAARLGWALECDVQLGADGVLVHHDRDLRRLAGRDLPVRRLTVGAAAGLSLAGSGAGVPSLPALLDVVAGRVPVFVELKRSAGGRELVGRVAAAVGDYRRRFPAAPVAVMSFDPRLVRLCADAAPELPRGLVCGAARGTGPAGALYDVTVLAAGWSRAQFVALCVDRLSGPVAAYARAVGPLLTWTVRDAADLRRAVVAGATPIAEGDAVRVLRRLPSVGPTLPG